MKRSGLCSICWVVHAMFLNENDRFSQCKVAIFAFLKRLGTNFMLHAQKNADRNVKKLWICEHYKFRKSFMACELGILQHAKYIEWTGGD